MSCCETSSCGANKSASTASSSNPATKSNSCCQDSNNNNNSECSKPTNTSSISNSSTNNNNSQATQISKNNCCEGSCNSCEKPASTTELDKKHSEVSDYYGKQVTKTDDLQTSCCTTDAPVTKRQRQILNQFIHPEILDKFYGCGTPLPPSLEKGMTVVDLGCGTGRDVYLISYFVGEEGKVIGIDMTDEQLAIALKHQQHHATTFNHSKSNVQFIKAFIEDLSFIPSNSVDLVISNCVINLSPDKESVLKETYRVLREGGELYFSDVFVDRRIPEALQKDKVLWGECLSGALYAEDFRRIMQQIGFQDHRIVTSSIVSVNNPEVEKKVKGITFYSNTVRAFKLKSLEDRCEDFGQVATYKGTIDEHPHAFYLDNSHVFVTDGPVPVCGNTADMLAKTRYGKHFIVTERKGHRGLFNCSTSTAIPSKGGCC